MTCGHKKLVFGCDKCRELRGRIYEDNIDYYTYRLEKVIPRLLKLIELDINEDACDAVEEITNELFNIKHGLFQEFMLIRKRGV